MISTQRFIGAFILPILLSLVSAVYPQSITVVSPNGGEYWMRGTSHEIVWEYENVEYVNIELSNGDTIATDVECSGSPQSWEWAITSKAYPYRKIKISDAQNPLIYDMSDSTFSIEPEIRITSPNGGEIWLTESREDIIWESDEQVYDVQISVSRDSGDNWESIFASSTENTGSHTWSVGDIYPFANPVTTPSMKCLMKVSHAGRPSVCYDISDSIFTIVRQIEVKSPGGTEFRYPGENLLIYWITSGLGGNVRIEYSINGGASWTTLVPSMPDTGLFIWDSIPDTPTIQGKVRVTHLGYTEYFKNSSTSYSGFTILRHIQVTTPEAGDTLYANTPCDITWSTSGIGGNVKIDYYDGSSWDTVTSSTPDTGSFPWGVPATPTNNARIKITHLKYPNNVATSDTFVITGGPTVIGVLPYCYPNPFSPTRNTKATVKYMIEKDARVTIKVYDVESNPVKTLIKDAPKLSGVYYDQDWDGKNKKGTQVANGVYFFVIRTNRGEAKWLKIALLE